MEPTMPDDAPQVEPSPNARARVAEFVALHGPERTTVFAAAAVAVVGALLPMVEAYSGFGRYASFSLAFGGFAGFLLLLAPVALGGLPLYAQRLAARMPLVGFGASCVLLGAFLGLYALNQAVAGSSYAGAHFALGYYATVLGYAGMTFGYWCLLTREVP
jgi:hypothetical protein